MGRSIVVEARDSTVEDILFALGECQDFIVREPSRLYGLIEQVDEGKLSAAAAKLAVRDIFTAAQKELGDWRAILADDAKRLGFPHLHPGLAQ